MFPIKTCARSQWKIGRWAFQRKVKKKCDPELRYFAMTIVASLNAF